MLLAVRPAAAQSPGGWIALFNTENLAGWRIPEGDNGHWRVIDGVIDYDALSEASGEKDLWSETSFRDFVLRLDWRFKETSGSYPAPVVLPDGSVLKDPDGNAITLELPNADSGVYLRGTSKAQVNMWCWPVGSGEVYGYRTDASLPPEVRAGVTPRVRADRPVGEWNTFEITLREDRLTVVLNGITVVEDARLPGIPREGPIALQHHGNGKPHPASSLVQFRNIFLKPL